MKAAITLLAIVFAFAGPAPAQESKPAPRKQPLAKGDIAPTLVLGNLDKKEVDLAKVFEKGPTVLVVLRGYPGYQCPICTRQVIDFVGRAKDFKETGAQVVFVYPGDVDNLVQRAGEFLAGDRLRRAVPESKLPEPFLLLVDDDYKLTNAYGLRWDAPRETAYPSTFIITPDREVTFAKVSRSHGGRAAAQDVLKELASPATAR